MGKDSKLVALVFTEAGEFTVAPGSAVVAGSAAVTDVYPTNAEAALREIEARAKAAGVALRDAVIAFKTSDGRIKIRQTKDLTVGKGAGRGGLLGLIVGLIFGGPLVGALLGLGIGGLLGRRDHGLDDDFIRSVGRSLKPKDSVLLLQIDQELRPEGVAYLESFNAELHITNFSAEAEEAVSKAAEDDAIAGAVEAEFAEE
jgi:uncharacterized membrane protein